MDHASANLIEFSDEVKETITIESEFRIQDKHETLQRSESEMHNKEQHTELAYLKEIAAHILHFDEVLLFGPTEAKTELLHFLRRDHRFAHIQIEVLPTDHLKEPQQHTFISDYFKRFDIKNF